MKSKTLLFVLLLAMLMAAPVSAQDNPPPEAPTDNDVNAVAKNMYCPVCENVPLDVCPTLACEQWREQIRELLAQGYNEQEVYDYFVLQYGDRVLSEPPRTGLNWLIYIVPPVVILIGMVGLYFALRSWRKPVTVSDAPESRTTKPDEPKDDYMARLEDELSKRQ